LWDQCNGFQPHGKAPAELKEGVIGRIGVDEDGQDEHGRVDVQIVVEGVRMLVVSLVFSRFVPSSRASGT
jgi:hypothetical protein